MAAEAYTLDRFLADTRATIKSKGIPAGLAEIREHLEKLLGNPELVFSLYRKIRTRSGKVVDPLRLAEWLR